MSSSGFFNGSIKSSDLIEGSVLFSDAFGFVRQDNSNLFWDSTNHRLAIGGAIVPTNTLTVHGSSYFNGDISQVGGTSVALSASTIQLAAFTTGIAHIGITGLISSSPVDLSTVDVTGILPPVNGGTGINNGGSTITLGGSVLTHGKFEIDGSFDTLFNVTAATSVIFPVSGTLLSSTGGGYVSSITGTTNQVIASASTGAVTLSLPQSIDTTSSPTFNVLTLTTALSFANGGTGQSSYIDGQLLIGNTSTGGISKNTLSGGTGITVTNGNGTISIAQTSGSNVTSITGTANQVIASAATGAVTLSLPQSIATSSSPSFAAVICSGGGGNSFQAFTNGTVTNPLTTPAALLVRNSSAVSNNWMTLTFLDNSGSVSALIGAQCVAANVNTDLVFYASSNSGGGTVVEGMRLIGSTNKLSLVNPLAVASGGTNIASYAVGDILYASATTTLSKLADVATGNALISGGVTTAPSWGKIGLTTHVSGTLGVGNGGTGAATAFTAGSVVFAGASGVYSQSNTKLFWDNTNNRLGIGTGAPGGFLDIQGSVSGSGAIYGFLLQTSVTETGSASGTAAMFIGGTHTINGAGTNGVNYLQVAPVVVATSAISEISGYVGFGPSISGAAATTNCYTMKVFGAAAVGAGGLTAAYTAAFFAPTVGTAKTTLYTDDISVGNGQAKFTGAANFSANGAVVTVLTGVGPTGARTTVQKWLTILDNAGNPFYIPCF